jgi:hypothetical protein
MSGQKSGPQSLAHAFALLMSEGNAMPSHRHRRLQKLMRQIADEQHGWLHERGLASLLASGPERDDHDPLADYRGDGSELIGLARLLFEYRQERHNIL